MILEGHFERFPSCQFGHVLGGFKEVVFEMSGGHSLGFVIFYLLGKSSKRGSNLILWKAILRGCQVVHFGSTPFFYTR